MTSGGAANGVRADDVLPTRVRAGYGLGSVATGSFGAVPGLLLLPLLTDNLGVAAWLAGLLVFLPKAWDVVFNPSSAASVIGAAHHPDARSSCAVA